MKMKYIIRYTKEKNVMYSHHFFFKTSLNIGLEMTEMQLADKDTVGMMRDQIEKILENWKSYHTFKWKV
jgi:hypothetical protein